MSLGSPSMTSPVEITRDANRRLLIRWADGHESAYDWEYLRWRCPCAVCVGEWGQPGMLATLTELTPQQKELVDLDLVGRYALNLVWGDGHSTGIYTFRALRSICPCRECSAGTRH